MDRVNKTAEEIVNEQNKLYRSRNPKDIIGSTKPDMTVIPASALVHLALPLMDGAEKYGLYNWREKPVELRSYLGAMLRHINSVLDGEDIVPDSKSGAHHVAAIMASCAIVLDAMECGTLIDNRGAKGKCSETINKFTRQK